MNQTGLNMSQKENRGIKGLPIYETDLWNLSPINRDLLIHELDKCKSEKLVRFQAQNKTAPGKLIDVDVSVKALFNKFNQIQTIILESRDITEQKQIESEMKDLIR